MAFNPGPGSGGGSSIAGSSDVSLNNLQDKQALTYDQPSAKWMNAQPAHKWTRRTVTGNYTIAAADANNYMIHVTASSTINVTLPADGVNVPAETVIAWRQYGDGQIRFVAASGVTLVAKDSQSASAGRYSSGFVYKTAANTWMVVGDTAVPGGTTPPPGGGKLATPTNLAIVEFSAYRIRVSCDAVSGAEEYHWGVRNSSGLVVDPVDTTTEPFRETDALDEDTYHYWVKASKADGSQMSDKSAEVTYIMGGEPGEPDPDPNPPKLAAPTGMSATIINGNQIRVSCNAVSGAERYVWGVRNSQGDVVDQVQITTDTERTSGAMPPMTYHYWVRASKADGSQLSDKSSEASVVVEESNGGDPPPSSPPAGLVWYTNYDALTQTTNYASQLGVQQTWNPAPAWQHVENLRAPGWTSSGANNNGSPSPTRFERMQVIDNASAPGSGSYKPAGRVMRHELRAWDGGYGDVFMSSNYYTNRAEMYARHASPGSTPAQNWPDPLNSERWYGFSWCPAPGFIFAGTNGISTSEWETLFQFKGRYGGSPPLGIDVKRQGIQTAGSAIGYRSLGSVTPGVWTRLVIGMKYSPNSSTGWVEIWRDGSQVIPRTSAATMKVVNGTPEACYIKQGIYRSGGWGVTHVTYYGPVKIGNSRADVMS